MAVTPPCLAPHRLRPAKQTAKLGKVSSASDSSAGPKEVVKALCFLRTGSNSNRIVTPSIGRLEIFHRYAAPIVPLQDGCQPRSYRPVAGGELRSKAKQARYVASTLLPVFMQALLTQ